MFFIEFSSVVTQKAVRRAAATVGMAGFAVPIGLAVVHREGMGKCGRFPGAGGVAGGALPLEVIGRAGVTGLAVGGPCQGVVEIRRFPGACVVASGALPLPVVSWAVLAVTGQAIAGFGSDMVENSRFPGIGGMA